MQVIGVRRDPERPVPGVQRVVGPDALDAVLPEADLIVLTVPLTPETRHLIGAAELALMKPSALILNVGRGGTIDQQALVAALQAGQIAGAGLDVTEPEPCPPIRPLGWITCSSPGAIRQHACRRAYQIFEENLNCA